MGYGFHPLGAWLANTAESLAMLLRPGNAGSNTFTDHFAVLTAAIRQFPSLPVPAAGPRRPGTRASHELISYLLSLSSRRRPGHAGSHRHPQTNHESDIMVENGHTVISNQPRPTPESSRLMSAAGSGRLLVIPGRSPAIRAEDDHL